MLSAKLGHHLGHDHAGRQPAFGDPPLERPDNRLRQAGKGLQTQQVILEIPARRRRLELAKLGEEQMQVGEMQVGGIADNRP